MLTSLAAVLLLSQEVPLSQGVPLSGRVLDAGGAPAANTTVTLLHRPIARHLDAAREHRVIVATDGRGTFKALLRDGATYSAWAATERHASAVEEGVDGGFVELRLLEAGGPRTVRVEGLDAWPEAGTFSWRAVVGSEHLDFATATCRGGELALPPLPPFASRNVEVVRADGEVLWSAALSDGVELRLPAPVEHTVRVTDPAGEPIADAEVLAHLRNYWMTGSAGVDHGDRFRALWPSMGRTGADGRLTIRLPESSRTNHLWLLTRKNGCRASLDGVHDGKPFRAGETLPPADGPAAAAPIPVVLEPAPAVEVPLRTATGDVLATGELFVVARVMVRHRTGGSGMPLLFAMPITAGVAKLPWAMPANLKVEAVWTTLAPGALGALRDRLGIAPPTALRVRAGSALTADMVPAVDFGQWRALHVVAADGRPAARIVVAVRSNGDSLAQLVRTDRLGRVAFPFAADSRMTVLAPAGTASTRVAADAGTAVTLHLERTPSVVGTVQDASGAPVADASITVAGRSRIGAEQQDLVWLLRMQPPARTTADGRFTLLLPPAAIDLDISATAGPRGTATAPFAWDPEAPAPLELRIDR